MEGKNRDKKLDDPEYLEKRKKNNESVKNSRENARKKAEQVSKEVKNLREGNKMLEGKIEEQKSTKKILIDLFKGQAKLRNQTLSPEQEQMINEVDFDDDYKDDSESEDSEESEPPQKRKKLDQK